MKVKNKLPLSEPGLPLYEAALASVLNPLKLHKHKNFKIPEKAKQTKNVWIKNKRKLND